jgi:hypothetical protein
MGKINRQKEEKHTHMTPQHHGKIVIQAQGCREPWGGGKQWDMMGERLSTCSMISYPNQA